MFKNYTDIRLYNVLEFTPADRVAPPIFQQNVQRSCFGNSHLAGNSVGHIIFGYSMDNFQYRAAGKSNCAVKFLVNFPDFKLVLLVISSCD